MKNKIIQITADHRIFAIYLFNGSGIDLNKHKFKKSTCNFGRLSRAINDALDFAYIEDEIIEAEWRNG